VLRKLADALNAKLVPALERALQSLQALGATNSAARWPAISQEITAARADLWTYGRYHILQLSQFRSPRYAALDEALRRLSAQLSADAPRAFAEYDHMGGASFFSVYPVSLDEAATLSAGAATLLAQADRVSAARILGLAAKYPAMSSALREELAARYVARAMRERGDRRAAFFLAYQILDELRAAGLGTAPKGARFLLVDTTQGTAGAAAGITLVNDSRLPLVKASAQGVTQNTQLQGADYLIVLAASANAPAKTIVRQSEVASRYVSGTRTVAKPAAPQAGDRQAQPPQTAEPGPQADPVTALGTAIARLFGREPRAEPPPAQAGAPVNPPAIEEAVTTDYAFKVATIEVTRSGQLLLSAWDRKGNGIARFSVPWKESRTFEVASGIHDRDPERAALLARYADPKALDAFENSAPRVALSGPIEKMMAVAPAFAPYVAGQEIFEPWQRSGGAPSVASGAAAPANPGSQLDTQLARVVIVRNPNGRSGAGFYVAPYLVLTNRHIVEGAKLAEVERFDGAKLEGRIVRSDPALDLSLIEVTRRGIPVIFQTGPIAAGGAVGAVGHPNGAPFSVTRGVVGAIVRVKDPLAPGGREILGIQSDAVPGNDGGPLYLDGLVIGIGSPRLSEGGGKAGGFALHHSELARFLRQ
jgi:S1-C subfamily serine protease